MEDLHIGKDFPDSTAIVFEAVTVFYWVRQCIAELVVASSQLFADLDRERQQHDSLCLGSGHRYAITHPTPRTHSEISKGAEVTRVTQLDRWMNE